MYVGGSRIEQSRGGAEAEEGGDLGVEMGLASGVAAQVPFL